MANLVVRNLDQRVVAALKQWADRHGRSAEAEHRGILEEALLGTFKLTVIARHQAHFLPTGVPVLNLCTA